KELPLYPLNGYLTNVRWRPTREVQAEARRDGCAGRMACGVGSRRAHFRLDLKDCVHAEVVVSDRGAGTGPADAFGSLGAVLFGVRGYGIRFDDPFLKSQQCGERVVRVGNGTPGGRSLQRHWEF